MNKRFMGPLTLLICSILWGSAFSIQSSAMKHVGPYTFVFMRSVLTSMILFLSIPLLNRTGIRKADSPLSFREHIKIGIICGVVLVAASTFQQIGLVTTTPAKSGFITALYILIVPIYGLFLGRKPSKLLWLGVSIAVIGLYFLCMDGSAVNVVSGDLITLVSAFMSAMHITVIDRYGDDAEAILFSALQFVTAAVVSGVLMLLFEKIDWNGMLAALPGVFYVALFSGAVGYTLQIIGQKNTEPTLASLIMCLEAVFAAIGGWVLLGQVLSGRELLGCFLMLSASVLTLLFGTGKEKSLNK